MSQQAAAKAQQPFQFYTSLILQESTGLRASTLPTLLKLMRTVPESSIYHHTHHFLLQHHYLVPEPTNDFAYWVAEVLGEELLGEQLASLDIMEYATLQRLREALAETVERYLKEHPAVRMRFVAAGEEFFFIKSVQTIFPIPYVATTLGELADAIERISLDSLYHHMFNARLRLGGVTNDFARWVTEQLGAAELGQALARLDPYAHTLETLRAILASTIRRDADAAAHRSLP